jgi:hypothetical protein
VQSFRETEVEQMCRCSDLQRNIGAEVQSCRGAEKHMCRGAQVRRFTGSKVQRCKRAGAEVLRC